MTVQGGSAGLAGASPPLQCATGEMSVFQKTLQQQHLRFVGSPRSKADAAAV